jgi:hypothetical protein
MFGIAINMPKGATFRVPRLYKAAAKIISVVREENGNLEQLVQLYNKKTNTKALSALVSKTLINEGLLDKIIQNSEILVKETSANPWLFRILITELLLGKQRLPIGSKPVQTVLAYGPTLRTELLRATGKLHKTRKRSKSEPSVKEADPECKQDSSTHSQTRVFDKSDDMKQELNSTMHSKSWCTGAQDYIRLEEEASIQSKSKHIKRPKNKQGKQDLGLEQLPNDKQISGLKIKKRKYKVGTHGSTRKKHKVESSTRVRKSRYFE